MTGAALNACYAYSYYSSMAAGAALFAVSFDDCGADRSHDLSFTYRYINTSRTADATSGLCEAFGAPVWDELVDPVTVSAVPPLSVLELSLSVQSAQPYGTADIWDFTKGNNVMGWYAGPGCTAVRSVSDTGGGGLRADFSGAGYSETGVICGTPEPLLYSDSLSFDVRVNGVAGALYEVKACIYSGLLRIEASAAVQSGTRTVLSLDTSELPEDSGITSVRICVRPVNISETDSDEYTLMVYRVSVGSSRYGSQALRAVLDAARAELKPETRGSSAGGGSLLIASAALVAAALVPVSVAAVIDRRRRSGRDNS
jgi:hypothetical protein